MIPTSSQRLTRLLANVEIPLEILKKRLILAIILLQLIDLESFGFSLEADVPFEHQKLYVDICRQSFLWVHQKLVSMLEPYEVIANVDIQAWYEDCRRRDLQVSPPQPTKRAAPAIADQIPVRYPQVVLREPSREVIISSPSPQIAQTYRSEPVQTASPIIIRSSNTAGTNSSVIMGSLAQGRPL